MLAAALAAGALLVTAACSGGDDDESTGSDIAASPVAERSVTPSPSKSPTKSPTASTAPLTKAGAETALIDEAELEDAWTEVDDASTWKDSLLIGEVDTADFLTAKTQAADCQRLLDGLYDDDLLGRPSGASALTGFTEGDSRLLYQVAAYKQADLDKSMDWLGTLPDSCDQFTANASDGSKRTVQVVEASLPKEGDARQGLTVTVQGTSDGSPVTLTLDVAVVQVGADAITVTNGGLDGADHDSTEDAVKQGTHRLKDVQAGRTPKADPSEFD
ncbi:hypothetical protein OG562_35965 [Streptomyces sp. NBC_01275]|uniref:hypothetical protein n=1 Tax=Streptomyces sp. NBC_01275 TaxID=2903807 RepID=UPI00225B2EC4|nr:hypothetical protein [Streptomyces sp. NBC_01275]MCX4766279.1 hypothetical protein [Streptomyces sp. NBC_01275]